MLLPSMLWGFLWRVNLGCTILGALLALISLLNGGDFHWPSNPLKDVRRPSKAGLGREVGVAKLVLWNRMAKGM